MMGLFRHFLSFFLLVSQVVLAQEYKLYGEVLDQNSRYPISKTLVLLRNLTDYKSYEILTDENGKFEFGVLPEKKYQLEAKNPTYFSYSSDFFEIKDTTEHSRILLTYVMLGQTFALENVSFSLNEPELLPCSFESLEKLFELLRTNPQLVVEIACHTDSRGDDEHSVQITQVQAQKVKDFLVKKGVRQDRLQAVGYGEKFLLNHCSNQIKCSNREHLQNRRTEYTILKIE